MKFALSLDLESFLTLRSHLLRKYRLTLSETLPCHTRGKKCGIQARSGELGHLLFSMLCLTIQGYSSDGSEDQHSYRQFIRISKIYSLQRIHSPSCTNLQDTYFFLPQEHHFGKTPLVQWNNISFGTRHITTSYGLVVGRYGTHGP
eukprot:PhF_6_TR10031/c0_g1_i6/m.15382